MSLFQLYFLTGDVVNSAIDHDVNLVVVDELDSIYELKTKQKEEQLKTQAEIMKQMKNT